MLRGLQSQRMVGAIFTILSASYPVYVSSVPYSVDNFVYLGSKQSPVAVKFIYRLVVF